MIASISHSLLQYHGPLAYVVCGGLVFAETALFVGFIFPGEIAALTGGALAEQGHANIELMVVVVVVTAIVGNLVGYEVGKAVGPWLMRHRPLKGNRGVVKAEALVARYGGPAVFLGRWIAIGRALLPGISGMSGMGYRTYALFSVIGGVAWGITFVMVGYAVGAAYTSVARRIGLYSLALIGVVVVVVAVRIVARRRRQRSRS